MASIGIRRYSDAEARASLPHSPYPTLLSKQYSDCALEMRARSAHGGTAAAVPPCGIGVSAIWRSHPGFRSPPSGLLIVPLMPSLPGVGTPHTSPRTALSPPQ